MPRLIIKQITLTNFKSYAGTKVLGPYDPHFTATVGPNGSGKSNTIDALLFVFGKRASKLRLKKVSELIHKSSDHKDIESATVDVHFREVEDTEDGSHQVVPNTDLIVSRTAFKNNTSKYYINGTGSSFTEVTAMLREKGIDLDNNRFLILQGEVEQISQMRAKAQTPHEVGLLEYLEDIIGSNKYVEAIEESGQNVDQLNETRNERLNRVKAVEKEKNNLEGSKAEAEKYLEKDQEVQLKRSTLYQLYRHESQHQLDETEKKKSEFQEKLDYERNKLKKLEEDLAEYEKEYDARYKEYQELEQKGKKAKKDFAEYERQDIKYREEIKESQNKVKKLENNYEKEISKGKSANKSVEKSEQEIPKLEEEVETIQSQKEHCEKKLDEIYQNMRGKTEELRNQLEEKQKEYQPYAESLNEVDSEINRTQNNLKMTQDRIEAHQQEIEKYETEEQEVKEKLKSTKDLYANTEQDYQKKTERKECAQKDFEDSQKELKGIQDEMNSLRAEIEESKASVSDASSQNSVIKELMSESRKGGKLENSGLAGRLGDLGTIDPKYDVAVSTACPGLSWLVTDTTEGAEQCVSLLQRRKLGRAKFVMMDKINWLKQHMEKRRELPSGAQRLFDLIDVPDKYRLAFYFVMRDTLVAENLDQAVKIAYSGKKSPCKVVTLDGELIDANGTMSGGGGRKRSGMMSLTGSAAASSASAGLSEKDIAKKEKRLKNLSQQYEDTNSTVRSLKKDISDLEEEIPKLAKEMKKMKMDIDAMENRLRDLSSQLEELRSKEAISSSEAKQMKDNERELKRLEKRRESIVSESERLKKDIDYLEEQIMKAGGEKLNKAKEELKQLEKQLEEKRAAITKAKVAIKTSTKNAAKAKEAAQQVQSDLDSEKLRLEDLQSKFKKVEDEALGVMQEMQNAEKIAKEKGEELQSVKEKFKKIENSIKSIRSVEVDITSAMEDCDSTISNGKKSISQFNSKLEQIQKNFSWNVQLLQGQSERQSENTAAEEISDSRNLPVLSTAELEKHTEDELKYAITILEAQRDELRNDVNMQAIQEYHRKEEEFKHRLSELEQTSQQRDEARKQYDALRKKRLDEFMAGFGTITLKLKEMYQMLTLGGDAELELVNSLDPFDGVVFTVRPPKKSWKNISNLSGGEKTLASLALVFALHHFKPTPLYVMDEIDAALDFKNVSIVANYIKERTKNAQFIIISLRNNMFELADRLVGIYKTNDATKTVTIDPHAFSENSSGNAAGKGNSEVEHSNRQALGDSTNQIQSSA